MIFLLQEEIKHIKNSKIANLWQTFGYPEENERLVLENLVVCY
jgi:hypothetical protein